MFGIFDVIQDILSNLRTFGLRDVIDIAVVSLAMYQILLFARKSRAGQLVRGLLLLLVFYALADVMQLRTVRCPHNGDEMCKINQLELDFLCI